MNKSTPGNLETQGCNVISFLDAAFHKGQRLTKEVLLKLCPDVEISPPKKLILRQMKGQGWGQGIRIGFDARTRKLMERFRGYIPSYEQREQLKYRQCPPDDAQLDDWIKQFLNHAKAKWSIAIDSGEKRQFADWLYDYLQLPGLRWNTGIENHLKAESLVRLAWGLSRFPPSVPSSQGSRK